MDNQNMGQMGGMPMNNMNNGFQGQQMPINGGNVKSATVAGLLGIFLGSVGAHNWYLGEKTKGIIHCCLAGGAIVVSILASIVIPNALTWSALLTWGTILGILGGLASLVAFGNSIWGLVEGIMILAQGDAGLARKGYAVAAPAPQPYYGQQPMNNMNGGQMNGGMGNMNNGGQMNGGMNNMNGMPMNGQMGGQMPQQNMEHANNGEDGNMPESHNN